jgi:hypothetical protein
VRNLDLGESGDVSVTAQCKNSAGRWVAARRPQKATRSKARVYVRGHDGYAVDNGVLSSGAVHQVRMVTFIAAKSRCATALGP